MDQLIVVRHGQSEQHVRDITGGWSDVPLTDLGREQARRAADRVVSLVGARPARLFASDLVRAAETAAILGERLGVAPVLLPGLRELGNGQAAGKTRAEAAAIALPMTEPAVDWVPYPDAESWRVMEARVFACMDALAGEVGEGGGPAVVVTHGNSGSAVIAWWLGLCEACRRRTSFDLDPPGSITVLEVNLWGERTISRLNDTAHLDGIRP